MIDTDKHSLCECCHAPAVGVFQGALQALCAACAKRQLLTDAAEVDLCAALLPAVEAWARRWHAVGLPDGALAFTLGMVGAYWHPRGHAGNPDGAAYIVARALDKE